MCPPRWLFPLSQGERGRFAWRYDSSLVATGRGRFILRHDSSPVATGEVGRGPSCGIGNPK